MADEPALLDAFDFSLPPEAIAQRPCARRSDARLLVLGRSGDAARPPAPAHRRVSALPELLEEGDLLVVNRTRVVAARLRGRKASGGRAEALLLGATGEKPGRYRALLRTRGRQRPGLELVFRGGEGGAAREIEARIARILDDGAVELDLPPDSRPEEIGAPPLPPYIGRCERDRDLCALDRERYQTVYAQEPGAVAAPTAGLHLDAPLLAALDARGVERASLLLHVGLGTFQPLRREQLASGRLHRERYVLPPETAEAVARARRRGRRVAAVGTTTTRVLEACARDDRHVEARAGETELFLRPGDRFRAVDALLTNFHLPRSSLLLLVCAFAGRERVLASYREAIARGYRFYSYGDAMWIG